LGGAEPQIRLEFYLRLAILADVHANLPALESVLEDADRQQACSIIVAGDLTGGPHPLETINCLRSIGATMIRGNSDESLLRFRYGRAPAAWNSDLQHALLRWTHRRLDKRTYDFLESLPLERSFTVPGASPIRVVHGCPGDPYEGLSPEEDPASLLSAMGRVEETVLICGHSHRPWKAEIDGRLALNPGAVCGPLNGVVGAQYALLSWHADRWTVEHRSVTYDLGTLHDAFSISGLLEEGGALAKAFLISLETGRDVALEFLDYARGVATDTGAAHEDGIPDAVWERAAQTFRW